MPVNIPDPEFKRIVIVGAGFAGLNLAKKLKRTKYQVVLVDKNNFHQFQPLFYQVAMAGIEPSSISFPLRKAFQKNKNVFIRVAEITAVDTERKQLMTAEGYMDYDYLVLAYGAKTNFYNNKEIEKHAYSLKSISEALHLRNTIFSDLEKSLVIREYERRQGYIDIVIVGGGPTGVELAGALAEMKAYILPKDYKELDASEVDIYLIQSGDQLLKGMSEKSSKTALKFLTDLGVQVKLNTRVKSVDGTYVYTDSGEKIHAHKVIWAAGINCKKMPGLSEEHYSYGNRLQVNRFNQCPCIEDVYALGDLAYMETENYPEGHPQVAQVAIQQAKQLSINFKNLANQKEMKPFVYKDLGTMATIGRNKAVVDLKSWKITGFVAWILWLFVHLRALIGARNKLVVFLNWFWNYITFDQSLRLIIKPLDKKEESKN